MQNYKSNFKIFFFFALFFCLVFFVNPVLAQHTEKYIDYASEIIYNDCKGTEVEMNIGGYNDICLKLNSVVRSDYLNSFDDTKILLNSLDLVNWYEYEKDEMGIRGSSVGMGCFGDKVIQCGDHWLNINGDKWSWDNKEIELPKIELAEGAKATFGDHSPIIDVNNINGQTTIDASNNTKQTQNNYSEIDNQGNLNLNSGNQNATQFQNSENKSNFWEKASVIVGLPAALLAIWGIIKLIKKRKKNKNN